jgi:hypothetical protein
MFSSKNNTLGMQGTNTGTAIGSISGGSLSVVNYNSDNGEHPVEADKLGVKDTVDYFEREIDNAAKGFVGREWAMSVIDKFIGDGEGGYLSIVGEEGIGRFSILSKVRKEYENEIVLYHLNGAGSKVESLVLSVYYQLVKGGYIPDNKILREPDDCAGTLAGLLREASQGNPGRKIILLVSCVDLVERGVESFLPKDPKAKIIVTCNRTLPKKVVGDRKVEIIASSEENKGDLRKYLEGRCDEEDLIDYVIEEKKILNFGYLNMILGVMGDKVDKSSFKSFPPEIEGYYSEDVRKLERDTEMEAISLMTISRDPLSISLMSYLLDTSFYRVRNTVDKWSHHLDRIEGEPRVYKIRRQDFVRFLIANDWVDVVGVSNKIVDKLKGNANGLMKNLRNDVKRYILVNYHLACVKAMRKDELFETLTSTIIFTRRIVYKDVHLADLVSSYKEAAKMFGKKKDPKETSKEVKGIVNSLKNTAADGISTLKSLSGKSRYVIITATCNYLYLMMSDAKREEIVEDEE